MCVMVAMGLRNRCGSLYSHVRSVKFIVGSLACKIKVLIIEIESLHRIPVMHGMWMLCRLIRPARILVSHRSSYLLRNLWNIRYCEVLKGTPNTDDIKLCVRDRVIHQIFGVQRHFRSDGGQDFNGIMVEHNLDVWIRNQYGSIWITGTPYNPNAQHLAERDCGVVKARIAKSQIDWTGHCGESLAVLEDILNSEPKADTGFSPYEMLTGCRRPA